MDEYGERPKSFSLKGLKYFPNFKSFLYNNKLSLAACSLAFLQPHALAVTAPPPVPPEPLAKPGTTHIITNPNSRDTAKPPSPTAGESFAIIEADQQGYDAPLGRYVAKGKVKVRFNGWVLLADRVEVAERSRSFYATGQVRLQKGDQYIQASSVRYSAWEGTGEMENVYGVIDQDTLKRDTAPPTNSSASDLGTASAKSQASSVIQAEDLPAFACPQLTASKQHSAISILPPGKTILPTMEAPNTCPGGAGSAGTKPTRLMEALENVVFQPSQFNQSNGASDQAKLNKTIGKQLQPIEINQRVKNVSFEQNWSTGFSVNLLGLVRYTAPTNNTGVGTLAAPKFQKSGGMVSRVRFQATNIQLQRNTWTARQMAFTNDPFTPALSWTIARNVTANQSPDGTTKIWARSGNIILENKYSLPAAFNQTIGKEKPGYAFGFDNEDRDGFYLGYDLKPIKIGQTGSLFLQPQLLMQRVFNGESSSFVAPGASLDSGNITQSITAADAFGLLAKLQVPIDRFNLSSDLSLATFNPDHLPSGTRNKTSLTTPLRLPGHNSAKAGIFGTYRERTYNGSLGLQNLIYAYGANISGDITIQTNSNRKQKATSETRADGTTPGKENQVSPSPAIPNLSSPSPENSKSFFKPINLNWQLGSGNYQANLYSTGTLSTLWRTTFYTSASSSFSIWEGKAIATDTDSMAGLRYSPKPIIPALKIDFGAAGSIANYSSGGEQNTLTFFVGPSLTLGHLDKPFFDYTRITASIAGTLNNGLSPFSFDRAVDLRTASFSVSQQIYGPVLVEAGITYNIDPNSIYNGVASYSYLEVKLKRRSYELGFYYSPYDGIGGFRIRLNDFNFDGTGTPFMPTTANSATPIRRTPS